MEKEIKKKVKRCTYGQKNFIFYDILLVEKK